MDEDSTVVDFIAIDSKEKYYLISIEIIAMTWKITSLTSSLEILLLKILQTML